MVLFLFFALWNNSAIAHILNNQLVKYGSQLQQITVNSLLGD